MTRESTPPVAKKSPNLLNDKAFIEFLCPNKVHPCLPYFKSQIFIFPYSDAEAI